MALCALASAGPLPNKPHVYVEGSATVEAVPDEVSFSIELSHTAETMGEAKAQVDERSFVLIDLCKQLGIADKDISTTALRVMPQFVYDNGKRIPAGTQVSRRVDIHLRDISQYAAVMQAFVKADISQTISTQLHVSDEASLTDKALVKALEDARARAEKLALAQGKKLGDAHSISEFMTRRDETYSLMPARALSGSSASNMAESLMRAPSEPFEPGVMEAKATVYVVYLLR